MGMETLVTSRTSRMRASLATASSRHGFSVVCIPPTASSFSICDVTELEKFCAVACVDVRHRQPQLTCRSSHIFNRILSRSLIHINLHCLQFLCSLVHSLILLFVLLIRSLYSTLIQSRCTSSSGELKGLKGTARRSGGAGARVRGSNDTEAILAKHKEIAIIHGLPWVECNIVSSPLPAVSAQDDIARENAL